MGISKEKQRQWEVQSFFEINRANDRVYRKALLISAGLHVLIFFLVGYFVLKAMNEPLNMQADREVSFVYEQVIIDAGKEKETHLTQKQNLTTQPEPKASEAIPTAKQPMPPKIENRVALPENTQLLQEKSPDLGAKSKPKVNEAQPSEQDQTSSELSAIGGVTGNSGIDINPSGNIQMFGPIVNRTILYSEIPEYPDWARKRGIETEVRMRIWVNAYGDVTDTMIIRKSGFLQIDLLVENSLRRWKFSALETNVAQTKQWGEILIRFVLY
jgi:TonB family protein